VLATDTWRAREAAHHARVDQLLRAHLERGRRGKKHPVEDFLFTYYPFRPAQLRRWHPGVGVVLADAHERASWRDHVQVDLNGGGRGVTVDVRAFVERRGDALAHVRRLLTATASRPAQFGCFGLHEWAMVYRQSPDAVRHAAWPLRLGPEGTDAVVEGHRLRCTHFDAYRFFTPAASPRNALAPTRADTVELEQPGCLHATMDLYRWASKLTPVVSSDLVVDAFVLARDVRELDMRASPYDLSALGYEPVPIETPAGRAEYVAAQRSFAERGAALRARLLAELDPLC
jgi:hypothetical protein